MGAGMTICTGHHEIVTATAKAVAISEQVRDTVNRLSGSVDGFLQGAANPTNLDRRLQLVEAAQVKLATDMKEISENNERTAAVLQSLANDREQAREDSRLRLSLSTTVLGYILALSGPAVLLYTALHSK